MIRLRLGIDTYRHLSHFCHLVTTNMEDSCDGGLHTHLRTEVAPQKAIIKNVALSLLILVIIC